MKIYALNGSPRKKANSAQLIDACIAGIKEANPDAEVEVIHLYDYTYTGCKSCFACQLKANRDYPGCSDKPTPSIFLYSMNATEELKDKFEFEGALCTSRRFMESNFQYKPE